MTVIEMKARVYDLSLEIAQRQQEIQRLNAEIVKLADGK